MNTINKRYKFLFLSLMGIFMLLCTIIPGLKTGFSFIWGSQKFSFNILNMIAPLIGSMCNFTQSGLLIMLLFGFKWALKSLPITYGIPTLFATFSWSASWSTQTHAYKKTNFLLHVMLPTICMILFAIHPIGKHAFLYACYWFVPMIVYAIKRKYLISNIFLTALSSTFIAHAMGSIIWLYTIPMTAQQWLGLIPIVAVERLTFASGCVIVYKALSRITIMLSSLKKSTNTQNQTNT